MTTTRAAVTVEAFHGYWKLTYVDPCTTCGKRHRHGAGPIAQPPAFGHWVRHCASYHKPFRDDCKVERNPVSRSLQCYLKHDLDEMVELYPVERTAP